VLSLKERDFIAAARGLGLSSFQLAKRHLLPNILSTVVVAATLRIGNTILIESFLSYLGLGTQEPTISWGAMIQQGWSHMLSPVQQTQMPG